MSKVFTITEGLENMGALRTGGQGSVYKGRRMGPVICAVKLLPTPIHTEDKNDKNFKNFQNEVEKLKKVNESSNPNVVKILNSGLTESGSFPFIEMEFIEGPDLEELLKPPHDQIFTIKEVIKLADHLANALAHCHRVGVKHGDIKSNNVKYNIHSGNYILLDFGLAIMSDEQRRTSIRQAGAVEFMAPEQSNGVVIFRTDIYSYGVVLYELLTGQVPFPLRDSGEKARNEVMIAHMESPVPDLLEMRRKNLPWSWIAERKELEMRVPQWLLQLVATCLEKEPENRYRNGIVLQEALVNGSIEVYGPAINNEEFDALKAKNAELTEQLLFLQQKEDNTKGLVKIPKAALAGMIILLIIFTTFGGYRLYNRYFRHRLSGTQTTLTQPVSPTDPGSKQKSNEDGKAGSTDTPQYNNAAKQDAVTDSGINFPTQPVVTHHTKKKRKPVRKKFLGIF